MFTVEGPLAKVTAPDNMIVVVALQCQLIKTQSNREEVLLFCTIHVICLLDFAYVRQTFSWTRLLVIIPSR